MWTFPFLFSILQNTDIGNSKSEVIFRGFNVKARHFFADILILLIAAGAVFFAGWVSFWIKPGTCAVMTSKTGGIYPEAVEYGKFLWRWERLLPTNTTLAVYPLQGLSFNHQVSGLLPSADVYSRQIDGGADFSYNFDFRVTVSAEPSEILRLVTEGKITNSEEGLDAYLEMASEKAAQLVSESLLEYTDSTFTAPCVLSGREVPSLGSDFHGLKVQSVEIKTLKRPDRDAYEAAKKIYKAYTEELSSAVKDRAKSQAAYMAESDSNMRQLEQFAELLEKYPRMSELSKSGDLAQVIGQLKSIH